MRNILKEEKSSRRQPSLAANIESPYELPTFADMEDNINDLDSANRLNEFKRISTCLIHVELYLKRICQNKIYSNQISGLMEWHNYLVTTLKSLRMIVDLSQLHLSLLDKPVTLLLEVVLLILKLSDVRDILTTAC